jgi:hypothetical protein
MPWTGYGGEDFFTAVYMVCCLPAQGTFAQGTATGIDRLGIACILVVEPEKVNGERTLKTWDPQCVKASARGVVLKTAEKSAAPCIKPSFHGRAFVIKVHSAGGPRQFFGRAVPGVLFKGEEHPDPGMKSGWVFHPGAKKRAGFLQARSRSEKKYAWSVCPFTRSIPPG